MSSQPPNEDEGLITLEEMRATSRELRARTRLGGNPMRPVTLFEPKSAAPVLERPAPSRPSSPPARGGAPAPGSRAGGRQHKHGATLTREQRKAADERRARAYEARARVKWAPIVEAAAKRDGLPHEFRLIDARIWRTCWAMVGDATGNEARRAFRGTDPAMRARALKVALSIVETPDGERHARYRWHKLRARRIAAFAWALLALSEATRRKDRWGGGVVRGLTRPAFAALLRDPTDRTEHAVPHTNTLFGTHRAGGSGQNGQVGYFVALREAGFAYRQQLPPGAADACERFGAYCSNRYWLAQGSIELASSAELADLLWLCDQWTQGRLDAALDGLSRAAPS